MHLGFGLYRHMLDREHLRFAKQCGATHIVVHLVDYFNQVDKKNDQPTDGGRGNGWGVAGDPVFSNSFNTRASSWNCSKLSPLTNSSKVQRGMGMEVAISKKRAQRRVPSARGCRSLLPQ